MTMNIGISEHNRHAVADILNRALADEYVLYTKTRNYHWNVVGPQFNDFHKFFESQYEALDDIVDEVAERVRALGHPSAGTLAEFTKLATIKEEPGKRPDASGMVERLLADHEAIIRELRDDAEQCTKYGDAGTNDFLTGLMERHEKMAWMLRAVATKP